jgi:ADP-ribose pyrophosphatase YjhB (NUDIX family)
MSLLRADATAPLLRLRRLAAHASTIHSMAAAPPPAQQHITWSQVLVVDSEGGRVLLGRHRSGQFEGEYTGFIGEVSAGETTAEAACRILREQSGLTAGVDRLSKRAVLELSPRDERA